MSLRGDIQHLDLTRELENFRDARIAQLATRQEIPPYLTRNVLSVVLDEPEEGLQRIENEDPNLTDARVGYAVRIRAVFDSMVHDELTQLRTSTEERGAKIEAWLSSCLDNNFDLFWAILDSACRLPAIVEVNNPLEYLDFMEELTLGFIRVFQKHPDRARLYEEIERRSKQKPPKAHDKSFLGAAIPDAFEHFEHFADACRKVPDARLLFQILIQELQRLTHEATHGGPDKEGKQKAYPVASSRMGWVTLFPILQENYPQLRVHTTTHEYLSMILNREDFDVVEGKSEEELIASFREALRIDTREGCPSLILMASVRRTGERVDVNRIMRTLRAEFPHTLFAIDGAQDHLIYSEADAVFYSKRFGATGTGVMMLSNHFSEDIHERCEARQGIQLADLAKTVAAFRCERRPLHFASLLSNLQDTPTIWNFVGGGSYMEQESRKTAAYVAGDPNLSAHFDVSYSSESRDEDNPNIWLSSRTIALHLKPESALSLPELARRMAGPPYEFQIDWISTESLPDFKVLSQMSQEPYSKEHCEKFFQTIVNFQTRSRPTYLTEMLTLPEVFNGTATFDRETYERQCRYLVASSKRQNLIRFHIDISKSPEAIRRCLVALSDVTSAFLSQVAETPSS